ncbi:hypothetical protein L6654_41330 [Bradyrhizobium sp. WYCCWR 13023]|uniref:Uncharacterized protein n=1 Tax=Bradyrhizobium zhengyangense TaxID=2911009 RepID=A0A9X1RLU9_9BRAD|nr:hypothetical protein [Bradyrhizobium zhengyangense]MCG2633009.1 hypothetical protein [Bradyrhizobium zhengyangense]
MLSRRGFLASVPSAASIALLKPKHANAERGQAGRLLLGLTSPVYFNGFSPFLNWWKTASAPALELSSGRRISGKEIWDLGGYLEEETGEIVSPAPSDLLSISRVFYKSANSMQVGAGCNYQGEEWTATWEGKGRGAIEFINGGGQQLVLGSNRIDFTTGADPDRVSLTLTPLDRHDPPRNVRIFQRRYGANVLRGEKFNPDWLAEISQFGTLRFMGWMPTNDETIRDFSQLADESYFAWAQQFISHEKNGEFGPKGSLHPQLICELANETHCNIHVCIPVRASDEFVTRFAKYFRDKTDVEVTYELSNECWNPGFDQFHYCKNEGAKIWPNDFWGFAKWYGYRSAECMNIIRNIYRDQSRWRGALATQTVDINKTLKALAGVNHWRKRTLRPARSLRVSDLFKSLYVTGYFGFSVPGAQIESISCASSAVCSAKGHGYKDGQKIKLFVTDGPTQLNDRYFIITNSTKDTFELANVSTVAMGSYLAPCSLATSMPLPQLPVYRTDAVASLEATLPGRLLVEGGEVSKGDVILVNGQMRAEQNGIYRVTEPGAENESWRLERVSYFDRPSTIVEGSSVKVDRGATAGTYVLVSTVKLVGSDLVQFRKVEPRNYVVAAELFELMDASAERHEQEPGAFPDRHRYFNEQVALAMRTGSCDTLLTAQDSVASLEKIYWPLQFSIASAYGLTLRQYEGGCGLAGGGTGLLGNPRQLVYGGNERFGQFVFNCGHSEEVARVYAESYEAFWRIGGEFPAKFVADGRSSNAGTWAGVRFWPLRANANTPDTHNPVWKLVLAANGRA